MRSQNPILGLIVLAGVFAACVCVYGADTEAQSQDPVHSVGNSNAPFQQVLLLLDLGRPELSTVKRFYDKGDYRAAFVEYKHLLVKRIGSFDPVDSYYFFLYGPADADELLEGELTTHQYGKSVTTTARIGRPGNVAWYRVPDDGYTTLLRDITTMQWVTKLAERYQCTGDVKYLRGWQGYWDDFATNWPDEYRKAKANPEIMKLVAPKDSIAWSDIALYIGWRLETFMEGFNAVCHKATENGQVNAIDDEELAKLLTHVATFEAAKGLDWIKRNTGVPNQRVLCATSLFELGVYLNDFKMAAKWRELGLMEVQRSGFLRDGSDMEQSLNYNPGLVTTIDNFLALAKRVPEAETDAWRKNLKHMYKYRYYFLQALAKPDGSQPVIGNNNPWRHYGKPVRQMPGLTSPRSDEILLSDFSLLPLSHTIKEYVYEKQDVAPPAFDSIYFPYGGYVVLRDGWKPADSYYFMKTSRPAEGHMREGGNGIEVAAYGQNIIVNSGSELYNPDAKINGYWSSTVSQNSICVDGYGQLLLRGIDVPTRYENPINARFLAGRRFDFAEGKYRGEYGGWNFKQYGMAAPLIDLIPIDHVIPDVTHDRQVIFLRNEKLWIVVDLIDSQSKHVFDQGWLFAPEYSPEAVNASGNSISTDQPGVANVTLFQYGIDALTYHIYYGVMEENHILGWVAKHANNEKNEFTPAVNVLTEWESTGLQVLITVIVPYVGTNPVLDARPLEQGFEMTLDTKQKVTYKYFGRSEENDAIEAELRAGDARLILTPTGGYETDEAGVRTSIETPTTFQWQETPAGEVPSYQ